MEDLIAYLDRLEADVQPEERAAWLASFGLDSALESEDCKCKSIS